MIKVTDLMVGDYVTFADCIENPPLIPIKIVALSFQDGGDEKSSLVSINNDKACDIIDIDEDIVGIPLTPEILEKNGFIKDDGGEETWGNELGWFVPDEYDKNGNAKSWTTEILGEPNSFNGRIYFVHTLQHALKLCGISKEIVI